MLPKKRKEIQTKNIPTEIQRALSTVGIWNNICFVGPKPTISGRCEIRSNKSLLTAKIVCWGKESAIGGATLERKDRGEHKRSAC